MTSSADWEVAKIYTIHKVGDINEARNCRRVALLDFEYNLLTNILVTRLGR